MSSTSQVPAIIKANEIYATQFDKGDLAISTAKKVTIVTCMDARIDPAKILGLEIGDVRYEHYNSYFDYLSFRLM